MGEDSPRVSSSICWSFCFLGFLSLAPIGLPRFRRGIDSFSAMLIFFSSGISILNGAFAARIWYLATFSLLMKTSGNWFAIFCKWIILWTSSSHWFVLGLKWDNFGLFQIIYSRASDTEFAFRKDGKMFSSKWQSSKRALKTSSVKGSRYPIIDEESKPI